MCVSNLTWRIHTEKIENVQRRFFLLDFNVILYYDTVLTNASKHVQNVGQCVGFRFILYRHFSKLNLLSQISLQRCWLPFQTETIRMGKRNLGPQFKNYPIIVFVRITCPFSLRCKQESYLRKLQSFTTKPHLINFQKFPIESLHYFFCENRIPPN